MKRNERSFLIFICLSLANFCFFISTTLFAAEIPPGWQTAQQIDSNPYTSMSQLATDAEGNAIAIWVQSDGLPQQYGLWANRYTKDHGWGIPTRINNYVGQADWPSIAMTHDGKAIAVWSQYSLFDINNPNVPTTTRLWMSRYDREGHWSVPQPLEDEQYSSNFASVVVDEDGDALVTYLRTNTAFDVTNVYALRIDHGGQIGAATLLQSDAAINSVGQLLAVDAHGQGIVAWTQFDPTSGDTQIWTDTFVPERGWQGPQMLVTQLQYASTSGGLSMDAHGNAVLGIQSWNIATYAYNVYAAYFDHHSGWQLPQLLEDTNAITADSLTISMNADGVAMAAWRELPDVFSYPFLFQLHSNERLLGQGWLGSTQVGMDSENIGGYWQLKLNPHGDAMLVGLQQNPDVAYDPWSFPPPNIYAYHFAALPGWDTGQYVQASTALAWPPNLAVGIQGDFITAWTRQDQTSGESTLWASWYYNH